MSTACDNCTAELHPRVPRSGPPWSDHFPIGQERGTQRDPEQVTLDLCGECQDCLGGRIGGPPTSVDLARFHDRYAIGAGHFTCRTATGYARELDDRGFRLVVTVAPAPTDAGTPMTWWSVREVNAAADLADGVVPDIDFAEAVRQAYVAARGDGWPEERT